MGVSSTKHRPQPTGQPVQKQQPVSFPPQPPYNDTPVEYHHVVMNATLDVQAKFGFMQPNVSFQSTNIDSYYPHLAAMYEQGYRMLVFVSLPGSTKSYGFSAIGQSQVTVKFQGIFRRSFPEEAEQKWQLRVEKSMLMNQMFFQWSGNLFLNASTQSGSAAGSHHIFQTIANITQNGGRLVSVELTGMAGQEMAMQQQMMQQQNRHQLNLAMTGQMPMMQVGVDVFYEIPLHPTEERYTYQIVSCPMDSTFQQTFPRGKFHSQINWQGIMQHYMGTGWKLVEIFEDYSVSTSTQQSGFTATMSMRKNCLWIFEKPVSRINDNTPYYEGTMVEHVFKTTTQLHGMGFGGAQVDVITDWEPLIEHMGKSGWQLVRILETPDVDVQGTFSPVLYTRQLIFFQRKIEGRSEFAAQGTSTKPAPVGFEMESSATGGNQAPPVAPPSYNELYQDKQ